jgi:DUF2075 family protein
VQRYTGESAGFVDDVQRNVVVDNLREAFLLENAYEPSPAEVRSWQNSLRAMADALRLGDLRDHGIALEWQLPLTSRRLDCLVTGHDSSSRPNAVIVELKQWDEVQPSSIDDCVTTFLGGRLRDVLHPSRQVGNYERYLLDVHTAFSTATVGLRSCSYGHNLRYDPSSPLFEERWSELLQRHPLFAKDQVDHLIEYLTVALGDGGGAAVLDDVLRGSYRPHKRLLEHTAGVIRREPTYVLLDEQQVVFNTILAKVRTRSLSQRRSAVIVRGGPGTGKSVLALNLVAELSGQGLVTHHATGSKAFTRNLRKVVGPRAAALFTYFNAYATSEDALDVLVCDEAHRIRENSNHRFTPKDKRSTRPQVEELLLAAKVSVFFLDDLQVVRPGETGSGRLLREAAQALGIDVVELELEAQFRCSGSDAYVQWIDNTLGVRRTPHVLWDPDDPFDFDVVDSPHELEHLIRSRSTPSSPGRLSAGYCWPWSDPTPEGTLISDVQVDGWAMPWNAKEGAGRLAKGIPPADLWATNSNGVDQVGCVYTAQGFEYDHAGVIWGRDLVYRAREGWVGQPEYSHDTVVKRAAKSGAFLPLVKNTYRVLLTRGLQSCAVYFEDEQTRDFVLSRIDRARR